MRGRGRGCTERNHGWGDSARRILRGWGVKGVKAAGVGEEPESRLCRAQVAEEVGERERFESERGKEGCTRSGVEQAVEEEMFCCLGFAAARRRRRGVLRVRNAPCTLRGCKHRSGAE